MSSLLNTLQLLIVTLFTRATGYVNDSELLPYLESAGSSRYYFADNGNVGVDLQQSFKFLGIYYTKVYISGNGYITFGLGSNSAGYGCYFSYAISPTVAVFMADADNRSDRDGAKLLYRQDTTNSSLNKVSKDIFAAFPHLEGQITLNWMLIATWFNIPPFEGIRALALRNTFQAILTTDTTNNYSFVLMYYNNINWPEQTHEGYGARVGIYYVGNIRKFLIPGSCTYSLLNIGQMSNFEQPGKLAFKVDTRVELPSPSVSKCIVSNYNQTLDVEFKPYVISPLRQLPLSAHHLKFCLDTEVNGTTCIFYDNRGRRKPTEVRGRFYPGQFKASCTPPNFVYSLGKMRVDVRLSFKDGNQVLVSGYVYVVEVPHDDKLGVVYDDSLPHDANLTVNWAKKDFRFNEIQESNGERKSSKDSVYLTWSLYELNGFTWVPMFSTVSRQFPNETQISKALKLEEMSTFASERLETLPTVMTISNLYYYQSKERVPASLTSDIVYTTMLLARLKINSTETSANVYDKRCKQWHDHEPQPPNDTLACPPTILQATEDWRFSLDTNSAISASPIMNPRNYTIYLQSVPSPSGAGSQCSYDNQGNLVIGNAHGSRMHRYSPKNWRDYWEYYWDDMMPYLQCCELSYEKKENCPRFYYAKRPIKFGYVPPVPFRASGATNIATLDGTTYLLNEIGTFYLLKYENQFEIQILTERYFGQNSTNNGVIITSAAIKTLAESDFPSTFQISANETGGLLIWQDNQPVNFYFDKLFNINHNYIKESFTIFHEGVSVFINGTSEALFSFSTGFTVKFMLSSRNESINIVGSASPKCMSCVGVVTGLVGNCDGMGNSVKNWRIPKDELLFQFPKGKTYENYNNVSIPSTQLSRNDVLQSVPDVVKMICKNVGDCQIDYMLTKDEEFAKSSIVAYEQFQKLSNATKINTNPVQCRKMNVRNGKFDSTDLNIGAIVTLTCDQSYQLNFINKHNSSLSDEPSFVCVPSNLLIDYNGANRSFPENDAVWVTSTFYQPLANFIIECRPINNSVTQNTTNIQIIANAEHCVYPGVNDFGIKTLVVGSVLQIMCPVHGKIENVTFTCMDHGNKSKYFGWVAVNNPFLSLRSCLAFKNEFTKSLYSAASSKYSNSLAVTLLSITTVLLFVALGFSMFYKRKKYTTQTMVATYRRASMTTNLLEVNDSMDN